VIHNFIDPEVYNRERYAASMKAQFPKAQPVLMHISNFRKVKRIRDIIRIFAAVNADIPSKLVMIGDGPDRVAAEEETRRLGVESSVSFLGKIDNVAPLLATADLFLLPSESESFGLSALEALASGVPVIGTNAGGLPEVVRDGETGFLCEGRRHRWNGALALPPHDPEEMEEMSELGVADARARFSKNEIVSQYEQMYITSLRSPGRAFRRSCSGSFRADGVSSDQQLSPSSHWLHWFFGWQDPGLAFDVGACISGRCSQYCVFFERSGHS
jgi:N-acetyl-alpha-D-glucosaminyl L-malate synthase BshA